MMKTPTVQIKIAKIRNFKLLKCLNCIGVFCFLISLASKAQSESFSKMFSLIDTTHFGFQLDRSRDLTFFFPNDEAVEKSNLEKVWPSLSDDEKIQLLQNHVVMGAINVGELNEGIMDLVTLEGTSLKLVAEKKQQQQQQQDQSASRSGVEENTNNNNNTVGEAKAVEENQAKNEKKDDEGGGGGGNEEIEASIQQQSSSLSESSLSLSSPIKINWQHAVETRSRVVYVPTAGVLIPAGLEEKFKERQTERDASSDSAAVSAAAAAADADAADAAASADADAAAAASVNDVEDVSDDVGITTSSSSNNVFTQLKKATRTGKSSATAGTAGQRNEEVKKGNRSEMAEQQQQLVFANEPIAAGRAAKKGGFDYETTYDVAESINSTSSSGDVALVHNSNLRGIESGSGDSAAAAVYGGGDAENEDSDYKRIEGALIDEEGDFEASLSSSSSSSSRAVGVIKSMKKKNNNDNRWKSHVVIST